MVTGASAWHIVGEAVTYSAFIGPIFVWYERRTGGEIWTSGPEVRYE